MFLFVGCAIWLFTEALAGRHLSSVGDSALLRAVMLYGSGLFAITGPLFLVMVLMGYPRIAVGKGLATLDSLVWRYNIDLARYGVGKPGYSKLGGQETACIFFYTIEHEAALHQTGQWVAPTQLNADLEFNVAGVVHKDRALLVDIAKAINAERQRLDVSVTLSRQAAEALSKKGKRTQSGRAVGIAVAGAAVLIFEAILNVPNMTFNWGSITALIIIAASAVILIWAHTTQPRWYQPIQRVLDVLDRHFWPIVAVLVLLGIGAFLYFRFAN